MSARGRDRARDTEEFGDNPARRPVWPHSISDDPSRGGRERPEHDAVYFDMRQRASNQGDTRIRLHEHQRYLKMLDFDDNPHVHMQRVKR